MYTDIWGPASVPASNGARYYVSFLDAFIKFRWIYVLHTKSQVSHAFKKFKALVENQTGHKICNLQTDNAREFLALTPFSSTTWYTSSSNMPLHAPTKWFRGKKAPPYCGHGFSVACSCSSSPKILG